jgi:hypothetical protein
MKDLYEIAEALLPGVRLDGASMPADPAIDVALIAYHGWETVRRAVGPESYARARSRDAVIGVEHLVAIMNGRPLTSIEGFLSSVVSWLERRDAQES